MLPRLRRVNVRVNDQGDAQWVESQVQKIAQEFNLPENGTTVEMYGGLNAAPKPIDRETSHWMQVVEQAGAVVDQSIRWKASGGASDGNKLASLGLSNIDTFGPEGDLLHSDQEWVRRASLAKKAILAVSVINQIHNESTLGRCRTRTTANRIRLPSPRSPGLPVPL